MLHVGQSLLIQGAQLNVRLLVLASQTDPPTYPRKYQTKPFRFSEPGVAVTLALLFTLPIEPLVGVLMVVEAVLIRRVVLEEDLEEELGF